MSTQIKYAYRRHNTWVYRRTYPKHLQELLGSSLKQSLKKADATTAKARVAELNQTYQSIIKEAESMYLHILTKLPQISILGLLDILWCALDISLFVFWVIGG